MGGGHFCVFLVLPRILLLPPVLRANLHDDCLQWLAADGREQEQTGARDREWEKMRVVIGLEGFAGRELRRCRAGSEPASRPGAILSGAKAVALALGRVEKEAAAFLKECGGEPWKSRRAKLTN